MKLSINEFINKANKIHQDENGQPMFDYSKVHYKNINSQIKIICKKCGNEFLQRAAHHLRGSGCKNCSIQNKRKNHPIDTNDFIKKSSNVHQDKYDYSSVEYINFLHKVSIYCKKCQKSFLQSPKLHLMGSGCQTCGRNSHKEKMMKSNENFISESQKKHLDINGNPLYDYSKTIYTGAKNKVIITCKRCGSDFEQRASHHLNGSGCVRHKSDSVRSVRGRNFSNTIEFIEKSVKIHKNKYDYSKVNYINNITKVEIYCNLCKSYFFQKPLTHLRGHGCQKCAINSQRNKMSFTNNIFIDKSKNIHIKNDGKLSYDYSKTIYTGAKNKVIITCKKCGNDFEQRASHHLNGAGCPKCSISNSEKYIERQLILNKIDYSYQYRFCNCKNKISLPFDFYLPKYNICIEFDGTFHYEIKTTHGGFDRLVKQKYNDKIKTKYCNANNIRLYRIKYSDDLKNSLQDIFDYIKNYFSYEV
jgi:hypothetical protein